MVTLEIVQYLSISDMFVPKGRAYDPATNTNWEGVGVAPDVSVKAEDALKTAQVAVLKKMAASEKNPASWPV